jgi:hypothetical protein
VAVTTSHGGGHSTRTAVVTSRLAFEDIAKLHALAEQRGTTVSSLISSTVHNVLPLMGGKGDERARDHD